MTHAFDRTMNRPSLQFLRAGFSFWSVLALVALANGIFCAPLLVSLVSDAAAQPITCLVYLAFSYPLIFLFFGCTKPPQGALSLWALGALWAVLTLLFEVIFFVGLLRYPATSVTEAFTLSGVLAGNLFAIELILLLVAPALVSRLARRSGGQSLRQAPLWRGGVLAEGVKV